MAPYWDCDFWQFFATFAARFPLVVTGQTAIAADELQIFVLVSVAISCGMLGPFLVLKKLAMLANSIAHTVLLGIALSYICFASIFAVQHGALGFPYLLPGAMAAALLTVGLTFAIHKWLRLQEDASIGLVFTALFALGVALVTVFTRDVHLGVEAVTGNPDALRMEDLYMGAILAGISATAILLCYVPLKYSCFDSGHLSSLGGKCNWLQALLLGLTAVSCISAFRIVGVLLVLSFLVGPYLIARLFSHRLHILLIAAVSIGALVSIVGVALARHILSVYGLALSTGGMVSALLGVLYPIAFGICRTVKNRKLKIYS